MAGGRRGPAPESAAVKMAKGNSGRRPIKTAAMEDEVDEALEGIDAGRQVIEPPTWLNEDGKKIWGEIAPRLSSMNILKSVDANTFGRYCQDFGRWVHLQKVLDVEGTTYESESPHGKYTRSHPAFMQAERLNRSMMMMESSFALNPADRQRLFAARAQAANSPDLFASPAGADPKMNSGSPIGMLN